MKIAIRVLLGLSVAAMIVALFFMRNANISAEKARIAEEEAIKKGNEIAKLNDEYEKISNQLLSSLSETERLKYQQRLLKFKNKEAKEEKIDSSLSEKDSLKNKAEENNLQSNEIATPKGTVSIFKEGKKKGCIDSAGNILIPAIYDELQVLN